MALMDVDTFELTRNESLGKIEASLLMQVRESVASPDTSFRPSSINITSRDLISSYVFTLTFDGKGNRTSCVNKPGCTEMFIWKTLRRLGENESRKMLPTSKITL